MLPLVSPLRSIALPLAAGLAVLLLAPQRAHADDLELTRERRAAIAKAAPEAKKFLVGADLIKKLDAKKPKNGKEANELFDKMAKGKWILFTVGFSSKGSSGFMLNVTWGEGDPLRGQTLLIVVKNPKGYDSDKRELGKSYPMLIKYQGGLVADPGYDLIGVSAWK